MKLKQWLREQKGVSYSKYLLMDEYEQATMFAEFQDYNRKISSRNGRRPMTEEEKRWANEVGEKEHRRYLLNKQIGGLDELGNYTALHHR